MASRRYTINFTPSLEVVANKYYSANSKIYMITFQNNYKIKMVHNQTVSKYILYL